MPFAGEFLHSPQKESLVLNDWAANTAAELISLKRRFASRRVLKVIARIQRAIS